MMSFSNEKEKRDAAIAGPIARCTDTTVCARPFVEPNMPLGAAEGMYMKIQPETARSDIIGHHRRERRVKAYRMSYVFRPS
jgi:hypothetical protein